jgi:hypothetical protein
MLADLERGDYGGHGNPQYTMTPRAYQYLLRLLPELSQTVTQTT